MNRRYLTILIAVSIIVVTAYLIWEHGLLTTVGNYMRLWVSQLWEVSVRVLAQSWEFFVRFFEFAWRPLLVFVENILRGMATRPFGKFVAWFFAGITLRYLVGPKVRDGYIRAVGSVRGYCVAAGRWWLQLPLYLRIVSIIVTAGGIAIVNVGLLLLPLGFLVEPVYRYIRNWIARESLERTSFSKRFNDWVYRWTRWLMRESPLFRKCLWPVRYFRLRSVLQARKLHYEYRKNGEGVRDMLGDLVKREKSEDDKDKPGQP